MLHIIKQIHLNEQHFTLTFTRISRMWREKQQKRTMAWNLAAFKNDCNNIGRATLCT